MTNPGTGRNHAINPGNSPSKPLAPLSRRFSDSRGRLHFRLVVLAVRARHRLTMCGALPNIHPWGAAAAGRVLSQVHITTDWYPWTQQRDILFLSLLAPKRCKTSSTVVSGSNSEESNSWVHVTCVLSLVFSAQLCLVWLAELVDCMAWQA